VVASNRRASAEYRKHLCRVMVRRALEEVLEGKEEV
jgi:CO/xanthine dehydrogenase FAD-binding subunit